MTEEVETIRKECEQLADWLCRNLAVVNPQVAVHPDTLSTYAFRVGFDVAPGADRIFLDRIVRTEYERLRKRTVERHREAAGKIGNSADIGLDGVE